MRVLAIETSERQFSIAALQDEQVWCELDVDAFIASMQKTREGASKFSEVSSASVAADLLPMISCLLAKSKWSFADVELLAVSKGPGSFTGLRSGIVAAKTLAFVAKLPLVAVDTLRALAYQWACSWHRETVDSDSLAAVPVKVCCAINAQRKQLYLADFQVSSRGPSPQPVIDVSKIAPGRLVGREDFLKQVDNETWYIGSGLAPVAEQLAQITDKVGPESIWRCRASFLGEIALKDYRNGIQDNLWNLQPFYFRPSYADEKLGLPEP